MADVMAAVLSYMASRQEQRETRIERTFAAMNPRERRLFREAAVMGYVQGVRSQPSGHNASIPPDSQIVASVIGHALTWDDLYPTIGRMARIADRRAADQTPAR